MKDNVHPYGKWSAECSGAYFHCHATIQEGVLDPLLEGGGLKVLSYDFEGEVRRTRSQVHRAIKVEERTAHSERTEGLRTTYTP